MLRKSALLLACGATVSGAAIVVASATATRRSRRLLRTLPPVASVAEIVQQDCAEDDSLDVSGVLWLEHINLVVGDRPKAEAFYVDLLGFTPDPSPSFHVNLGRQQLHLSVGQPQVIAGIVGLAVPSLLTVRQRLPAATAALSGTCFAVTDQGASLRITCPWGNIYALHSVTSSEPMPADEPPPEAPRLVRAQAGLDSGMGVSGLPGIRYIEFFVPTGTAPRIATFYEQVLGCRPRLAALTNDADVATTTNGRVSSGGGGQDCTAAVVPVGPSVHLVFSEHADVSADALRAMEGDHIAVYVTDWKECFERAQRLGLAWTNPRFVHLDTCDDFEQARGGRQFRFRYLVDVTDAGCGEKLLELEHETRALRHFQFFKPVHYEPK